MNTANATTQTHFVNEDADNEEKALAEATIAREDDELLKDASVELIDSTSNSNKKELSEQKEKIEVTNELEKQEGEGKENESSL